MSQHTAIMVASQCAALCISRPRGASNSSTTSRTKEGVGRPPRLRLASACFPIRCLHPPAPTCLLATGRRPQRM